MFGIRDGSTGHGYQKRGRKPGKRKDFMSDPDLIAKRQKLWLVWRLQNEWWRAYLKAKAEGISSAPAPP
jgi:hypothetical protein